MKLMGTNLSAGLWRLADPKISITSAASIAVGAALAADYGAFSSFWVLVLGCAMFAMEVAKNAWGEVFDYDSGTDLAVLPEDRTNFSGGKRVLVDNLLSRRQTWAVAGGFCLLGLLLGAVIVFVKEPEVFWIGVLGLALGWSYHGPPLKLAYRGLGELDVAICYGPLIALATYLMLTGVYSFVVVLLGLPLGILIAAFLLVNEFPDYDADCRAGKKNLVVRLTKSRAAKLLPVLYAFAFGILLYLPLATALPATIYMALIALPAASLAVCWTLKNPETFHRHKPAQPAALIAFVLYSAGVTAGILVGV